MSYDERDAAMDEMYERIKSCIRSTASRRLMNLRRIA
jgi:hypothetical protein